MSSFVKKNYGFIGLGLMLLMFSSAIANIPILDEWVTPVGWMGYILFIDHLVYRRQGTSLLLNRKFEFLRMLPISIALWCIFEWHNLYCKNWEYIGLNENIWIRALGFAIAFSTILPAMIETREWLRTYPLLKPKFKSTAYQKPSKRVLITTLLCGITLIAIPCIYPSRYTGPLIWAGYFLLFIPLNHLCGISGLLKRRASGDFSDLKILCLTGLICGFVWETLNFWAQAKWIYHVPFLEELKIFEMPVLGFLGFIPFAFLFLEMYYFVDSLIMRVSRNHPVIYRE